MDLGFSCTLCTNLVVVARTVDIECSPFLGEFEVAVDLLCGGAKSEKLIFP